MATTAVPSGWWRRAETLRERVERLRARRGQSAPFDAALATRELALWRDQAPFGASFPLERRLAVDAIDAAELERVLGEDALDGDAPPWARTIEDAYSAPTPRAAWSIAMDAPAEANPTLRFLDALEPLLRRARRRLLERAREIRGAPFDPETAVNAAMAPLPWTLHSMLVRPMVLELNVARVEGRLAGTTPAERFEEFARRVGAPDGALAFLAEYPVLARIVLATLDRWERASAEFLERLAADWSAIVRALAGVGPSATSRLVRIDGGAGDSHRDGRSVLVAHFDDGARVVYKPRGLAVDVHFQELLAWANRAGDHLPFRTLAVLDRGDHGWVEFVAAAPCASEDEVRRFYRRQGGLIALLYVLEAIDFHYENLIASGEHPVLVDLESLFHARVGEETVEDASLRLVTRATARSVLRIGILPQRVHVDGEFAGVDLSGLGGAEGQLTPERVLQWSDVATDTMRARRERVSMPGAKNLPSVGGEKAEVIRYEAELQRGFAEVYRLIAARRDELVAPAGPIARFANDPVRCVLRPTHSYGSILTESFHPDNLRDGLERDRFLDRIWIGVDTAPHLERVVAIERADLERLDVPVFTTTPSSLDLVGARGERVRRFLDASGMQLVERKLRELDEADLRRQLWFVHASLATLEISKPTLEWTTYPAVAIEHAPREADVRARLVAAARRTGDRMLDLALRDERDVAWVGLQYDDRSWSMVPLLEDLYSGSAGVVLFLAHLGATTGDARYTSAARAAFGTWRHRLDSSATLVRAIGAFNGWGGAIWTLAHLARLWREPELLHDARAIVERVGPLVDEDAHLDVIGGSAGLVAALCALQRVAPHDANVELARRAGDRLVRGATRMSSGAGWFTRIDTELPITGFSHGAAGIAWALCELHALTGEERYRATALDGVLYERARLVAAEGNWLETSREELARPVDERRNGALSVAWCYGAPGVGLARLRSMRVLDHAWVREDLEIALDTTLRRGFGRNHSLCHGDLGNLDFVMQAAEALEDATLRRKALEIQATVLASIDASGFLSGVPLGVESPSLMNGLAGIGYGLLRAAMPERIPSVLTLDAPST